MQSRPHQSDVGGGGVKPRRYPFWCQSARDIYDERIAIARADLRLDDKDPTPPHIEALAVKLAEVEQSLVEKSERLL